QVHIKLLLLFILRILMPKLPSSKRNRYGRHTHTAKPAAARKRHYLYTSLSKKAGPLAVLCGLRQTRTRWDSRKMKSLKINMQSMVSQQEIFKAV
uniref:Uncharacterized protein n=1 Tax=Buteo japonicus TaxID=224669 RepID=A0A8C0AWK0_9AVES